MLKTVLKHELAPATPLMFSKEGDMLMAIQKHVLKDKLQVDVSYRSLQNTSVSMVDLCAILWILEWSVNGVIEEIPENMFKMSWICYDLKMCAWWSIDTDGMA